MKPSRLYPVRPLLFLLCSGLVAAQDDRDLPASADFSQESIRACTSELLDTWNTWAHNSQGLEDRALRLPMVKARELVQRALGDYLGFLDKRRAYAQAVATYVERLRAAPEPGNPVVSEAGVYQDQVLVLGVNLSSLQAKLQGLRDSAEWVPIRRAVQADRDAVVKLEATLRARAIPQDLAIGSSHSQALMSSIAYQDSERELAEVLRRLWTDYYQALIDGVEQHPAGATPLRATRSSEPPASTAVAAPPLTPSTKNPLVGVWDYVEGSQQFNGVAEPRHVLLELWIESGDLVGRYRAELPDFSGERKIDLRLRAPASVQHSPISLEFHSTDQPATGEIILEGPLEGAAKLMLVRNVDANGPIPRGRELLHRR